MILKCRGGGEGEGREHADPDKSNNGAVNGHSFKIFQKENNAERMSHRTGRQEARKMVKKVGGKGDTRPRAVIRIGFAHGVGMERNSERILMGMPWLR